MKCAASRLQGAFPVVQAYLKETVSCCEKLNLKLEGFFVFVFSFLGGGGCVFSLCPEIMCDSSVG